MQPLFLSCISNLQDADSNTTSGLGPDNRNSGDEMVLGFPGGSAGKESACDAGDLGSIPGLGKSPAEGKGHLLQYSGLENSMGSIVHGVAKSQTRLSNFHLLPWSQAVLTIRILSYRPGIQFSEAHFPNM